MEDRSFDVVIFKDKTFGNVLEDIYNNSRAKANDIDILIADLRQLITSPSEALIIVPLISDYLGKSIENDSQLVKMASIVQRVVSRAAASNANTIEMGGYMSDAEWKEIQQLAEGHGNMLFNKQPIAINGTEPDKQQ